MTRQYDSFTNSGAVLRKLMDEMRSRAVTKRAPGAYVDDATGEIAGSAAARGICRYLKVSTWRSEAMYRLPTDGHARLLYLYLLTGPHTLACHVPGLYQVGRESLREELRLKPSAFNKALKSLTENLGAQTDFSRSLAWIPSALEHLGPPANPNIVKAYCRALADMPASPLVTTAIFAYDAFLETLGDSFLKPFRNRFPWVCQTTADGLANYEFDQSERFGIEKEKEKEKEIETAFSPRTQDESFADQSALARLKSITDSLR